MNHQQDNHFHVVETEAVRLALGCFNRNHQISEKMGDGESGTLLLSWGRLGHWLVHPDEGTSDSTLESGGRSQTGR